MTSDRHLALMALMNEIAAPSRTYQHCVRKAGVASSISPQYDAAVERGNAALDDIEGAVRRWVAKNPAPVADATDPTLLRWGLNDVMWGDDDSVTVLLSGPNGEPYWLELDADRATVLRQDLAGPDVEQPPADRAAIRDRIAEALYAHNHPGWATRYTDLDQDEQGTYLARADAVLAVLPPPRSRADVTAAEVAHALDNATPYPIELDSAVCRFMAERLLEMLTLGKRPEHPVWQPEEQAEPGEQPQPQDPAELRRMADEAQP